MIEAIVALGGFALFMIVLPCYCWMRCRREAKRWEGRNSVPPADLPLATKIFEAWMVGGIATFLGIILAIGYRLLVG